MTQPFTPRWAIEHYDALLRAIAVFPTTQRGKFHLLRKFVTKYHLDYQKARTDYLHILRAETKPNVETE